jgi:hypothetical protein
MELTTIPSFTTLHRLCAWINERATFRLWLWLLDAGIAVRSLGLDGFRRTDGAVSLAVYEEMAFIFEIDFSKIKAWDLHVFREKN